MKYFILISVLAFSIMSQAETSPQVYYYSTQANQALILKQFQKSLEENLKAIQKAPFESKLYINLGLSFEAMEQFDSAAQSYLMADKYAQTNVEKFIAYFNLGQLFGKQKKIDEAITFYQKALDFDPTSREVKVNIELLIQQGGGGGGGDQEDKDKQESDQQDKNENKKDSEKDPKDPKDPSKPQEFKKNKKYQMQPFESKDLSEQDVKKIFEELKQQEQRIRQEFNKDESPKESTNGKDW